jgi:hypothetical protein
MGVIVPRLVDLDKSSINEPNIILELWDIGIGGSSFVNNRQPNLVNDGFINARCNENCTFTYYILILLPYENIVHYKCCHVSCTYEVEQSLL